MKNSTIALCTILLWMITTTCLFAQIPPGYYNSATGSGATLKTNLYNIIKGHTSIGYDNLWGVFPATDDRPDGKVWDMYSNCNYTFGTDQCGNVSNNECFCYNKEHSLPASWFNNATPMYSDLFHIVPTDGKVNNLRGSYPFGETNAPTDITINGSKKGPCSYPGYTGTVFEPIDEYKGDFARNYFYMATRYENVIATWYSNSTEANAVLQPNNFPVFETWFLNMLGAWHVADPVSQKEIDRNNEIYNNYQHNRNPFIDHPEYVYSIWGVGQGLDPEPTNHAADFSAHCITLNWADATGAVVPTGYLVRMSATSFAAIATPSDGSPVTNDFSNINVSSGVQTCIFKGLTPNATYYFKIFPYTGSGASIDYKTNETVQQVSLMAK